MEHYDVLLDTDDSTEKEGIEIAQTILSMSIECANEMVDYDDMLYMPLIKNVRFWQNDFVFVDEAQDTNGVQRALLKRMLRPRGRLIAVGDPHQAIYGFRGADSSAMDLLRQDFDCKELPLSVSYRCAQNVVKHAQRLVPHMEAFEGATEGAVIHHDKMPKADFFNNRDAILCRNTAPLVSLAYSFIRQNIGCRILGREIGQGLVSLIKRMRAKNLDELEDRLTVYRDREVAKFVSKGMESKAGAITDKVECVFTVIGNLTEDERSIPDLVRKIESLFRDTNGVLTLCTQHKSKGLEWDRVFILRPDLNPSSWARQEWQKQQEKNLQYVAETRAKQELHYLPPKEEA